MEEHHTIGMAGHIDHGKTTLTKALTGIDTDRLKEEKERGLSIEPGFAALHLPGGKTVSIVDVPGHNRLIRQMIAGVAGIDLVLLIVAADEGIMPQTKEHLDIIELLGIQHGIIVLTKTAELDEELLALAEEEILGFLIGKVFEKSPIIRVDSITGDGINELKIEIAQMVSTLPARKISGPFRMPIDQVFTMKGHGVIARGTVQGGAVHTEDELTVLPSGKKVKVRQLQVHYERADQAQAGQRAALNIAGIEKNELQRGDILVVNEKRFSPSKVIDVALNLISSQERSVKQRSPIRIYIGTAVVDGQVVFFDRNEAKPGSAALCQIRLKNPIAVQKGDRFILRRPSPAETIGGGIVIDPAGERYKFGEQTIAMLERKKCGTPLELVTEYLFEHQGAAFDELQGIAGDQLNGLLQEGIESGAIIKIAENYFSLASVISTSCDKVRKQIELYHNNNPLDLGITKAELFEKMRRLMPELILNFSLAKLEQADKIFRQGPILAVADFSPHPPVHMHKQVDILIEMYKKVQLMPEQFNQMAKQAELADKDIEAVKHYLIREKQLIRITEELLIHKNTVDKGIADLKRGTGMSFTPAEAKEILGVSRKYMIPFLEWLDNQGMTERIENKRFWTSRDGEK